jgi:hypothetical protein
MSNPPTKADWKAVSIKFEPRVDQLIEAEAKQQCRTKTDQIRFILRAFFEEREKSNDRMGD